jgi:hypothetical protein
MASFPWRLRAEGRVASSRCDDIAQIWRGGEAASHDQHGANPIDGASFSLGNNRYLRSTATEEGGLRQ